MRLTWYIIRLHIGPFLFGTSAVVFIFLLQFIFKFLNDLVGKGLSYGVIAQLVAYNLAWMLVLAAPMGVLVATLMAYGKLSGNNELTIVKSSGGSAFRAMLPAIVGGALLFLALFYFNDRILPEANHRAFVLQNDIKQLKPTFAIDPGRFSTLSGYSILARRVDRVRNILFDVTIYGQAEERLNVINAREARLEFNHDFSKLLMTLHDGEVQQLNRRQPSEFRRFTFGEYKVAVATSGYLLNKTDPSATQRTDRTMNIAQMRSIADTATRNSLRAARQFDSLLNAQIRPASALPSLTTPERRVLSDREAAAAAITQLASVRALLESESGIRSSELRTSDQYWVEIHKKWSIPAACFVFVFVGAPLGIVVRRGNFGVSASIALGFFIIYWACLVGGEKLADRALLSPAAAMWMADAIIGLMGLYLTILVSRETVTFSFDFAWLRRLRSRRAEAASGTESAGGNISR